MLYELPENLGTLSADELQALIDSGLDAFNALGISPDSDEDTIKEGERIAPLIAQVNGELNARRERASRAQAAIDVVAQATTPTEPDPDDPDTPPDPDDPVAEVITPDEVIPAEPVPASGSPARRAAANATAPAVPAAKPGVVTLLAAADVPGFATGSELDGLDSVTAALIARMKGIPTTGDGSVTQSHYGVATIRKGGYGDLSQAARVHDDYGLVMAAGNESRLPGGSLVAAGGWCAPSETLYDMCQFETTDGLLSIPEFQVTRGGIRFTEGPDFEDIYTDCGFAQTEAQAIAGTAKTCCIVDCPPFTEIRMDVVGLCVKTPLLTETAYPELTRRFLEGALVAHAHKINASNIADIVAAAGTPVVIPDNGSVMANLEVLALQAELMRYRWRLGIGASIEIVLPLWFRSVVRADLALRGTSEDHSDAAINKFFSDRNIAVQWVYDWQNLIADGAVNCAAAIPATATVLMYPAGTWTRGVRDVINVNAVYDSAGLECNIFTALFMEEGTLTVQKCLGTCAYTVGTCPSGAIGQRTIDCLLTDLTGP